MAQRVVTQKNSFGGRFLNSAKGILVGLGAVLICSILLVCNEAGSVKNIRAFDEVSKNYIAVPDAKSLSENNGRLVALQGGALVFTPVSDPDFGITSKSFRLSREVELYQRIEDKQGTSTDKEVTYTYNNAWRSNRIDSSKFYDSSERNANANVPSGGQYSSGSFVSDDVKLGDFALTREQANELPVTARLIPTGTNAPGFKVNSDYITNADCNLGSPKIGDVRISYKVSDMSTASAIGEQSGNNLVPYTAKNGTKVLYLSAGLKSGKEMTAELKAANSAATWFFRILLCVFICIGFSMLLTPVQVLLSMIPLLGKFLSGLSSKIAGFIGAVIGIALSLLIISISWIAVRPLIGIPLLIVVVALIVLAVKKSKDKEAQPAEAEPVA